MGNQFPVTVPRPIPRASLKTLRSPRQRMPSSGKAWRPRPMSREPTGPVPPKDRRGKSLASPRIWSAKKVISGWHHLSLSLCRLSKPCSESTVQFRLGSSRSRPTKRPVSNQTEAVTLSEPTRCGQGGPAYTAANSSDSGHGVSSKDRTQVTPNEGPQGCLFYTFPAKFINSKARKS